MSENAPGFNPGTTPAPAAGPRPGIPLWIGLLVIAGSLLTAMGAVVALLRPSMLVSPQDTINEAVRIYAGYLAARNLGLASITLALFFAGAQRALGQLMVLVGFIQLLDVCMDVVEGRWVIVPGVLVFGVLYLVAAARLSGAPFWKRSAWI